MDIKRPPVFREVIQQKNMHKGNGLPFSANDSDDFDYLSTTKDINKKEY